MAHAAVTRAGAAAATMLLAAGCRSDRAAVVVDARRDAAAMDARRDAALPDLQWPPSVRDAAPDACSPASLRIPDGGVRGPCIPRDPGSFGGCGEPIGYVFDGSWCVPVTGCTGESVGLFAALEDCALACAADGQCNEANLDFNFDTGFCDAVQVCGIDPAGICSVASLLLDRGCTPTLLDATPDYCSRELDCTAVGGDIDAAFRERLCALSLLPFVRELYCVVFLQLKEAARRAAPGKAGVQVRFDMESVDLFNLDPRTFNVYDVVLIGWEMP